MGTEALRWLGHASFRIEGSAATVYIDPWKIAGGPRADLVLVTHEHFDHCSPEDVARIAGPSTIVVAPEPCRGPLARVLRKDSFRAVEPGDSITERSVAILVVPAYNTDPSRQGFHPRDPKIPRVGYIVTMDGRTIYHAGDTDSIPEMEGLAPDVALLPVGGTYTMTAEQAAEAARRLGAAEVVPMHWGDIVGSRKDAERFASLWKGRTRIMEPG